MIPKKQDLIPSIYADIKGELDTIALYDQHITSTADPVVKRVLTSVRDEEKVHVGELTKLLKYLDPDMAASLEKGDGEASEIMQSLGVGSGS